MAFSLRLLVSIWVALVVAAVLFAMMAPASGRKKESAAAKVLVVILFAVGGCVAGALLFHPSLENMRHLTELKDSENGIYAQNNRDQHVYFYDEDGKGRIFVGMNAGQAGHSVWSKEGAFLLALGTYSNDVRSDEKGLPSIVLNNSVGALKALFRLDGPNQNPMLIFKDNAQNGKLYMGVGLGSAEEEPFLIYFNQDGSRHSLFGDLDWHP